MKKILLIVLLIATNSCLVWSQNIDVNSKISYETLYTQSLKSGMLFPDIAFAQAVIESAHFKSRLFIRANNLFGMQFPVKRATTAIGSTNGYSKYNTWNHSIMDYKLWQEFVFKRKGIMSRQEYLSYIKKWYAKDPNYINKIKNIINRHSFIIEKVNSESI